MTPIEMSAEELTLVRSILDAYVSDLHTEIHHTDNREYRQRLKREDELLRELLRRMEGHQARSSAAQ